MAEEEIIMEVEALQAVYGEDCSVLKLYPLHLRVYIKPRTADDHSQQFVEVCIEIQGGLQYPGEMPDIRITSFKGLDEKRLEFLSTGLREKAHSLLPCSMLIALCEEAVEKLTIMNHPDGDCPLCLDPLFLEKEPNESLPFMKLMSCFHCFHRECIVRWWNWLQTQNQANGRKASDSDVMSSASPNKQDSVGSCPVCRKSFGSEDIKHVVNLVDSFSAKLDIYEKEDHDDRQLLESDLEASRRETFERVLQLQKGCGGLIEARTSGVLFSSVTLSELAQGVSPTVATESTEHGNRGAVEEAGPSSSSGSTKVKKHRKRNNSRTMGKDQQESSDMPASSSVKNSAPRKFNRKSSRTKTKQWIQKEKL